jgi:bacteriorhodopsin
MGKTSMSAPEDNSSKPKYKWPWFVLAAVVLGIVLAVVWVGLAAKKVESQRDYGQPLPDSAPAR